ncbi:MAG: hypothetical protein H0V17_17045 [Deltaproteobacteria bacterium]|nr:hypothetical protein [Deltaproteobacteria bacterium]
MRGSVLVCSLVMACGGGGGGGNDGGGDPDGPPSPACVEATTYQDITNIESEIFVKSCTFSGCHNGGNTDAGMTDLRAGAAHAHLVGVASKVDTTRTLVVAGNPAASYLLLMIGQVSPGEADPPGSAPPANIGLMPQSAGGVLLCKEKRDAIERWITAGAPSD